MTRDTFLFYTSGMSKPDTERRSLIHLRLPDELVARVDTHAAKMQVAVAKIAPKAQVSRNDAVVALLTQALNTTQPRRRK